MNSLIQDIRYGLRMIRTSPGFTLVVLLTIALGIAANTIIFSVVNTIVLRPLAYKDADRLAFASQTTSDIKIKPFSVQDYYDWRDNNQVFDHLAAFRWESFNITGDTQPERLLVSQVTANVFPMLGVEPLIGNVFTPNDDKTGANPVVVLSHGLWQRRFGGDPNVVGHSVNLDGQIFTILGVMPADFRFYPSSTMRADLWMPIGLFSQQWMVSRNARPGIYAVGRLKDGVSLEQAQAEMNTIASRLEQQYPDTNAGHRAYIVSLHRHLIRDVRTLILLLLGAVVLVLLISCANVANLLLARAARRQREISIRAAMGATKFRLIRQLLTESVVLSVLGAIIGLGLAYPAIEFLISISPPSIPRISEITIDGRVLWFTFGVSVVTGLIFGLTPALHSSKTDLSQALKETARSSVGAARKQIRNLLVISEVAIALVLLVASILIMRSFVKLVETSPGFETTNVLTMQMALPANRYPQDWQRRAFAEQLVQRLKGLPAVESAAVVTPLPLSGEGRQAPFTIEGRPAAADSEVPLAELAAISPDYFQALSIPLVRGRYFTEQDTHDSTQVVIIDETMAKRHWPNEDPIGKQFKIGPAASPAPWMQIVGIVGHTKNYGVTEESRVEMFRPYAQMAFNAISVVVRTSRSPEVIANAVRGEIGGIDKDQPVYNIRTMETMLATTVAPRRLSVYLLGAFALLALILEAIGVYSVLAYTVTERVHEIGVRMALGAQRSSILKLIMGQGLSLVVIGMVIGLAGSVAFNQVVGSLLYGVSTSDVISYMGGMIVLTVVAVLACYLPAKRATKVDPLTAIRYE
jgi:putative ABC transport system permease protein